LLRAAGAALCLRRNAFPRFALGLRVGGLPVSLCFGLRRQLQNRRALALTQVRQQNDLSIREFEGVVVRAWIVHLDLPEAGDPVNERLLPEDKLEAGRNALDLFVKRDLGPRQEAHGHVGFFDSTESARGGVPELRRYQLVFDLCGSRSNTL
jgi:hypothetical protein